MDNSHLFLFKKGEIRIFSHREIAGTIRQATVKKDKINNYYATFVVEKINSRNYSELLAHPVGIDVGLIKLIATTDNDLVEPPKY